MRARELAVFVLMAFGVSAQAASDWAVRPVVPGLEARLGILGDREWFAGWPSPTSAFLEQSGSGGGSRPGGGSSGSGSGGSGSGGSGSGGSGSGGSGGGKSGDGKSGDGKSGSGSGGSGGSGGKSGGDKPGDGKSGGDKPEKPGDGKSGNEKPGNGNSGGSGGSGSGGKGGSGNSGSGNPGSGGNGNGGSGSSGSGGNGSGSSGSGSGSGSGNPGTGSNGSNGTIVPEPNRNFYGQVTLSDGRSIVCSSTRIKSDSPWMRLAVNGMWLEAEGQWQNSVFVAKTMQIVAPRQWAYFRGPGMLVDAPGKGRYEIWYMLENGRPNILEQRAVLEDDIEVIAFSTGSSLLALPEKLVLPNVEIKGWVRLKGVRQGTQGVRWTEIRSFP